MKSERRKSRKNANRRRTEASSAAAAIDDHKINKRDTIGQFKDRIWIDAIEGHRKHNTNKRHNHPDQHRLHKRNRKFTGDTIQYVDGNGTAHKLRSNVTKMHKSRKHAMKRPRNDTQSPDEIDLQSAHSSDDTNTNGVAAQNVSMSEWKLTVNGLPLNGTIAYENDTESLYRVKRKSGKATGALRPKGSGDSGSKSTSRKKDGKCNIKQQLQQQLRNTNANRYCERKTE